MLRFIIKNTFKDKYNQCEGSIFYTIDNDIDALEKCLKQGGMDEYGYERHELIGVEIYE